MAHCHETVGNRQVYDDNGKIRYSTAIDSPNYDANVADNSQSRYNPQRQFHPRFVRSAVSQIGEEQSGIVRVFERNVERVIEARRRHAAMKAD